MGADYLAHALIDTVVDNYFSILERLGDRIEFLEEELVDDPRTETLHTIHALKRELIILRKSVWPLREVVASWRGGARSCSRRPQGSISGTYTTTRSR